MLFWLWVECGGFIIRDERGLEHPLVPNRIQKRIWLAMMEQASAGRPVRLRIGKARRGGTSTFVCGLYSFLCSTIPNQQGYCIAHRDETVDALQRIGQRAMHKIGLARGLIPSIHRYDNGSFERFATSGGQAVGAGDTLSLLHWSERAKWGLKKDETAADTAIAAQWADIIVDESTFKGRDAFWLDFDRARNGESSYRALFLAWYEDERCTAQAGANSELVSVSTELVSVSGLDDAERALIRLASAEGIELGPGQLLWRRQQIADLGAETFKQEYPSSPEEAIQAGKGLILPFMRGCLVDAVPFDYASVPWSQRVGGVDFGYNDPCVIWSGVAWDGALYMIAFWRGVETLAAEQVEGLLVGHTYYCDPANLSDRKSLQRQCEHSGRGVTLLPAPRYKHPGEDLEKSELQRVIDLASQERLFIVRGCSTQLICECDDLEWNEVTGKPKMVRSPQCGHYDSVMGLKYAVLGFLKGGRRPDVPAEPRLSRHKSFTRY